MKYWQSLCSKASKTLLSSLPLASLSTVRQGQQHTPLWSPLSLCIPLKTCATLFCVRPLYRSKVPEQHSLFEFYFASSGVMINCLKNSFSSPENALFFLLLPASYTITLAKRLLLDLPHVCEGKNKVASEDGTNTWLAVLSLMFER